MSVRCGFPHEVYMENGYQTHSFFIPPLSLPSPNPGGEGMFRVEAVKVGIKTNHQTDALNFAHSPLDGEMKRSYHDNGTAIPTPQLTGSVYLWLMRSSVQ